MKIFMLLIVVFPTCIFAESTLEGYFQELFNNPVNDSEWAFQIDDIKFAQEGLEFGLQTLESNLASSQLTSIEKNQVKQNFVDNYINQSVVLLNTYTNLINHPDLKLLLQEFLRQASTQLWLEEELKKDPSAIEPTKEEIDIYYQENAERLFRLGLSAAQIKQYTEQELRQLKLKTWTKEKIDILKSQVSVTINPEILKKYKIKTP